MIIGKSLTALGGGGLKPEITVIANAGVILNLHYKDNSTILKSHQLGAGETQYTFVVSVSETAYIVEDATNGISVEVLVDTVAQYIVEFPYTKWLYNKSNEYNNVTGGWSTPSIVVALGNYDTYFDNCRVTKQKLNSGLHFTGYRTAVGGGVSHFFISYYTNNRINMTNYSTLKASFKSTAEISCFRLKLAAFDMLPVGKVDGAWVKGTDTGPFQVGTNIGGTVTLDISSLTGSYYVSIIFTEFSSGGGIKGNGSVLVESIWME